MPAFAAHRLGDQEVLDLQIVEAGRVELHEFHVGDAAARPPRHGDAVAGRAARRGRIKIGAARSAGRQDRRPRGQRFDRARSPCCRRRGRGPRRWSKIRSAWRPVIRSIATMSGIRVMLELAAAAFSSACCTAQPVASATWTIRRWLWPPSRVKCSAPFSVANGTPSSASRAIAAGASLTTCSTTARLLSPAPAIIVSRTWASKLSPSSSTAAIPPWAQPVAPS